MKLRSLKRRTGEMSSNEAHAAPRPADDAREYERARHTSKKALPMKVCPRCNGRGWIDDGEDCPDCNGTGQVEDDGQEPAPIREPDRDNQMKSKHLPARR
jgi:RecJ-like exonuclease